MVWLKLSDVKFLKNGFSIAYIHLLHWTKTPLTPTNICFFGNVNVYKQYSFLRQMTAVVTGVCSSSHAGGHANLHQTLVRGDV